MHAICNARSIAYQTASIVFIHGFTGHPERTWTHKKGVRSDYQSGENITGPPHKLRKLNTLLRAPHQGADSYAPVYWPRDLVPTTVPYARVLTYGYDTRPRHVLGAPGNQSTVYEMAWDFLVQLEAERRPDPCRPIVFIAHSLGGIFVKEALRRSAGCQAHHLHLGHIFSSTAGIIFFGTPHGGADPRGLLQRAVERVVRLAGYSVNEHVVNTLLPSSERLRELRDEFNPVAQRQNWVIYSFQEGVGIAYLNGEKVGLRCRTSVSLIWRDPTNQHLLGRRGRLILSKPSWNRNKPAHRSGPHGDVPLYGTR